MSDKKPQTPAEDFALKSQRREPPKPGGPRCGFCNAQPVGIGRVDMRFPDMICAVFVCDHCAAVLSVAPIARAEQQRQESRIIIPN